MKYIFAWLKKYSLIITALAVALLIAGFVLFQIKYVFPSKIQNERISTLIEEGGAFAASQVASTNQLFARHEEKVQKDQDLASEIIDIFELQRTGGVTDVVEEEAETEEGEGEEGVEEDVADNEVQDEEIVE